MRNVNTLLAWLITGVSILAAEIDPSKLVASAKGQIGVTVEYDPAYRKLSYPGGDVPQKTGVCSDVVVRALREQGLDLQKAVHEDMKASFQAYPGTWGLKKPDANIDHRRVLNLMTYFRRQGFELCQDVPTKVYRPGDIVAWDLGKGITHIGILSDRTNRDGTPRVIHNIGHGTQEEDILLEFKIIGQYRLVSKAATNALANPK